jgi:hypothetical protein
LKQVTVWNRIQIQSDKKTGVSLEKYTGDSLEQNINTDSLEQNTSVSMDNNYMYNKVEVSDENSKKLIV